MIRQGCFDSWEVVVIERVIPNKVKIGGVFYEIAKVDSPPIVDGRACTGAIDYENAKIELLANRDDGQTEQTLWHEILHGIAYDRKLQRFFGGCDEDHEAILDALASGLHAFMVDNGLKFPVSETPGQEPKEESQ